MAKKFATSFVPAEFKGSAFQCGRSYGQANAEGILSFLLMETAPDTKRLRYAARCWDVLQDWEKPIADFVRGMAEGSGRTVEEITLLLLHEEIVHQQASVSAGNQHCSGLGATGAATVDGAPIIGMNWDWRVSLYTWSSLLRLHCKGIPATLTYAFPGLWTGAGINEEGLAFSWTGAGYLPVLKPLVGVPTYALIAGILTKSSCREAIQLVESTPIAGCFVFFLADKSGELWVVEGGAGKTKAVQCHDVIGRGNHYETPEICRVSKQVLQPDGPIVTTCGRAKRVQELLRKYNGRINDKRVEEILRDHHATAKGQGICQHGRLDFNSMTVDGLYFLPRQREMRIARGLPCRHEFQSHTI